MDRTLAQLAQKLKNDERFLANLIEAWCYEHESTWEALAQTIENFGLEPFSIDQLNRLALCRIPISDEGQQEIVRTVPISDYCLTMLLSHNEVLWG